MGNYRKLGKNVLLLTVGSFASKILSFLLVPLYTAVLTTDEYGVADILTTSINLILPIFTLLVYEAVMRFTLDITTDKKQVFSVGFYITVTGSIAVLVLSQIFNFFESIKPYMWLFILYYISLAFYNLVLWFAKGLEKVHIYSTAGVINTFVYIISNIIFLLVLKIGVVGYLLSFIVGHFVAAIFVVISGKMYKYIVPLSKTQREYKVKMFKYSVPMIPNSISWWIATSFNRYVLLYFWGTSVNGVFSVAYKIPTILTIMADIFIGAWQISAVENFGSEESKKFYSDIYEKYESFLYIGTSCLIGMATILARFLFSNDFYQAWVYTPILLLAATFSSLASFYGSIYTSAKKTKFLFYSTMVGAIGNIVLNLVLTPKFGAMGAGISTAGSYMLVWVIRAKHSQKIFKFDVKIKRNILAYFILGIESILICTNNNPYYIVSIISVFAVCILCRKSFTDIVKAALKKIHLR